jgi:hypothetical protein
MKKFLDADSKKFLGFREAGILIKKEAIHPPEALVVAGSPRMIRYYSGINFQEFGGRLIPIPHTKDQFLDWLAANDTEVFLIVDYWERTQPSWIFPLTQENRRFLSGLGFRLIKRIDKNILSSNGKPQNITVVWVFKKDKEVLRIP